MKSALIIGIKPKSGGPPPPPPGMKDVPGQMGMGDDKPDDQSGDSSGKMPPEKALVIRAGHNCEDCQNYHDDTGECDKVEGQFSPDDACLREFEAKTDSEPDSDDQMPESNDSADDASNNYGPQ
jgi:hypothetical protein